MTILHKEGDKMHFDKRLLHRIRTKDNAAVLSILKNEETIGLEDSSKANLLHYAAVFGNAEITKCLLDQGLDVDAQDVRKQTPLLLAVLANVNDASHETIRILLQGNANMFVVDCFGAWALQAVLNWESFAHTEAIKMFLDKLVTECNNDDALIAAKLLEAECSLERATLLRNSSVLKIMIQNGCRVNARHPRLGHTALHTAVHLMDLDSVKLLTECGADINAKDFKGRIPLFYYNYHIVRQVQQPEIIRLVVNENTQLTGLENDGLNMQISAVMMNGNNEAIKILLGCDIDFRARNRQDKTVLHFLAMNSNFEVCSELKSKQIEVNAHDFRENTPLFYAAYSQNLSMVQFLLENGAQVNLRNAVGWTPLIYSYSDISCIKKHGKIVQLLFKYGGNLEMVGLPGKTVFDIVKRGRNFDHAKSLLAHLAVLYKLGDPLTDLLLEKIGSDDMFKNHFDFCLRKLKGMDKIVVNDSITMFTIFNEPEEKIVARCIYSSTLLSKLININRKWHSNCYYFGILQERLGRIIKKIELTQNAAFVISKFLGLYNNQNHIIVHKIVNYLNCDDMQVLNDIK